MRNLHGRYSSRSFTSSLQCGRDPDLDHMEARDVAPLKDILSLVNKYAMDSLRPRLIRPFQQAWPKTPCQWDQLEIQLDSQDGAFTDHLVHGLYHRFEALTSQLPDPAPVIRLAGEFDIPAILPAAFYHLSRFRASILPCQNAVRTSVGALNWES